MLGAVHLEVRYTGKNEVVLDNIVERLRALCSMNEEPQVSCYLKGFILFIVIILLVAGPPESHITAFIVHLYLNAVCCWRDFRMHGSSRFQKTGNL